MTAFKNNSKETGIIVNTINIRPINRQSLDIGKWRTAMIHAEGLTKQRRQLLELYDDALNDGHLKSIVEKRIKAITNIELKFYDKNGEENEELSNLTEKPFFETLLKEIINSKFWGYSLLELEAWDNANAESKTHLIDRRHVKPELGIVVRNSIETTGIPYNEDPYVRFVVRAGEDKDKGLLLQAAQYAIYKRNGISDYAEFCEVFGMPFRHATYSDPENKEIIDNMFEKMGAAGYVATPEGVEINSQYSNVSSGSSLHNDFRKACNDEMSVTILGQTETTNSSASSGYAQSKTHADVLHEIHEDDRQFVLRVLNVELNRVLINFGFKADGTWKFVDKENINLKERVEIDIKLKNEGKLPITDDYLYQRYNIPKPENYDQLKKEQEEKAQIQAQTPPSENLADFHKLLELQDKATLFDKIKSFFFEAKTNLDDHYSHHHDCTARQGGCDQLNLRDKDIEKAFFSLATEIYEGKITRNQLHQGMYNETANELLTAVLAGHGNTNIKYNSPDNVMLAHLKSNIFAFSGAKDFEENNAIRDQLFDAKGKLKPFNKFRDDVTNLHNKYNSNYLQAEYQTAQATSRSASNWLKYERDSDIYPFLEYRTSSDKRVRAEHARLHGFTARIDDPVWDSIYPPNGYRCRCSVKQRKDIPKNNPTVSNEDIRREIPQKAFRTNAGKTKTVFNEGEHPYFQNTKGQRKELNAVTNYGLPSTKTNIRKSKVDFQQDLNTVEKYKKWYDDLKNTDGDIIYSDHQDTQVAFSIDSFNHILGKKQLKEERFKFADIIELVIQEADEIYSLHHKGKRSNTTKLTQRYIKFFKDTVVVANTIEKGNKIVIETYYKLKNLSDESYRSGVLILK